MKTIFTSVERKAESLRKKISRNAAKQLKQRRGEEQCQREAVLYEHKKSSSKYCSYIQRC